jgi:hypothetical protein
MLDGPDAGTVPTNAREINKHQGQKIMAMVPCLAIKTNQYQQ